MAGKKKLRVGLFKLSWSTLHNDLVGVADALKNIVVIGANQFDDGVGYCAISIDDQFDEHDVSDPNNALHTPVYELKMGINADGSRTHRWKKQQSTSP